MIFWILFFIGIIIAFFWFLPVVKKNVTLPQWQSAAEQPEPQEAPEKSVPEKPAPEKVSKTSQPVSEKSEQSKATPAKPPEKAASEKPAEKAPAPTPPQPAKTPAQEPSRQQPASQPEKPAAPTAAQPAKTPAQEPSRQQPASQPEKKPAEIRDRTIYFVQEGSGGVLQLAKTNRKLEVSDSPLIDCINAVLRGPNADEQKRGFFNCIPPNSRLLSANVSGSTVTLDFNEEFRYNTEGREDSAAQLKQIVWTATEFPNVNDVQIKINGRTVDFLVEGIPIRNPLRR